jgi:hypothetical protein
MMSLRLDAGRLDDGPPFLDVGLLRGGQCLGRLLLAREKVQPKIAERCAYLGAARASTAAAFSLSMIGFGVPLGAKNANQAWK